jgi:hypothetical protein
VIDTTTGWNGVESVAPFGDGFSAGGAYGQTFVPPDSHSVLESFSFWVWHAPDLDTSGQPLQFSAVVMAWATDRAAEPVLFESSIQTIDVDETVPMEFVFTTGGLHLTPGQKYVAFLNASTEFWDHITTSTRVGFLGGGVCCGGGDAYTGGEAWFLNTFGFFQFVSILPWGNFFGVSDLAFRATFSDTVLPVDIKIKPKNDRPNDINLSAGGVIPVAILSSEDFDAVQVDVTTLAFGPDGADITHQQGHIVDIDADGDTDLLTHFRISETGIVCGDTQATLTGETFAGEPVSGSDVINTVNCP